MDVSNTSNNLDALRRTKTVPEWCKQERVCPATFYNHRKRDPLSVPAVIKIGKCSRILPEAEDAWRTRMLERAAAPQAA